MTGHLPRKPSSVLLKTLPTSPLVPESLHTLLQTKSSRATNQEIRYYINIITAPIHFLFILAQAMNLELSLTDPEALKPPKQHHRNIQVCSQWGICNSSMNCIAHSNLLLPKRDLTFALWKQPGKDVEWRNGWRNRAKAFQLHSFSSFQGKCMASWLIANIYNWLSKVQQTAKCYVLFSIKGTSPLCQRLPSMLGVFSLNILVPWCESLFYIPLQWIYPSTQL